MLLLLFVVSYTQLCQSYAKHRTRTSQQLARFSSGVDTFPSLILPDLTLNHVCTTRRKDLSRDYVHNSGVLVSRVSGVFESLVKRVGITIAALSLQ